MTPIAVGCFWFAARGKTVEDIEEFAPDAHLEAVRTALEGIKNISNVKIENNNLGVTGMWPEDTEDQNFFPMYVRVTISFDIFMPKRLQDKFCHGFRHPNAETFHVRLVYGYELPVVYIFYDADVDDAGIHQHSPSDAVAFIRKYLAEKLKDELEIQFECLGPSPFHADLFVEAHEEAHPIEHDVSLAGAGYRTLRFSLTANPGEDVISAFITHYHPMFGAYYQVVRYRNHALKLSSHILNTTRKLFEKPDSGGQLKQWGLKFSHGHLIDDVFQSILEERLNRIELNGYLAGSGGTAINRGSVLYGFIEREVADMAPLPTDDIKEVLKILEDRRLGYFGNAATLISGVVGGLVGALIGIALGSS